MRVADYIIDFLVSKGVSTAFVLTGNGAMFLDDAAAAHPSLNVITVRNEANAPAMAAAHYRISGTPALVLVTSGPGAANAMSGVVEAWVDGSPIFVLAGQAEYHAGFESLNSTRTFGLAGIPAARYAKAFTKFSDQVQNADVTPLLMEQAWAAMTTGHRGPVWLDVPGSVQAAPMPALDLEFVKVADVGAHPNENPAGVLRDADFGQRLLQSKKPLVVLGQGARGCTHVHQLLSVCERNQIPVALTRGAADIVGHNHPAVVGVVGVRASLDSPWLIGESDLLLLMGARDSESLLGVGRSFVSRSADIVQISWESTSRQVPRVGADVSFPCDLDSWLSEHIHELATSLHGEDSWWARCSHLPDLEKVVPNGGGRDGELDLYWVMKRIHDAARQHDVLVTDAGSNYYVGGQVFTHSGGTRELTSLTFAAMGLSLPLAIGAASAMNKDGIVWAITGDGSIELSVQELSTLALTGFNIKLFVINNGGHLSMRIWQDTFFDGRRIGSDDSSGGSVINFLDLAKAFRVKYVSIQSAQDLDSYLINVVEDRGPELIEVFCSSSQKILRPDFKERTHSEDM